MDELLALLAYYPEQLREWIAYPETWQEPMQSPQTASQLKVNEPVSTFSRKFRPKLQGHNISKISSSGTASGGKGISETPPFKLFQPAHQRHYLVGASLVCQQPGLPDRRIDPGRQEKISFVVRRVIHRDELEPETPYVQDSPDWEEYAFVNTPSGYSWKYISHDKREALEEGGEEERLPLFAINFKEESGYGRRLLAGSVPVGRREAYLGAPRAEDSVEDTQVEESGLTRLKDPRTALFIAKVTAPWKALIEQSQVIRDKYDVTDETFPNFEWNENKANADKERGYKAARDQLQTASWYLLLDFNEFLEQHVKNIWDVITGDKTESELSIEEEELYQVLNEIEMHYNHIKKYQGSHANTTYYDQKRKAPSLPDALRSIRIFDEILERITSDYDGGKADPEAKWPDFFFPFTDPGLDNLLNGPIPDVELTTSEDLDDLQTALAKIDAMAALVEKALPEMTKPLPDIQIPDVPMDPRDGWFIIRCVYERPNCGPFHPAVVSRPTEKFQMAAFFDPYAPARQVRISMPMDISPAGLRKFRKNATLMMSDMLCGKIKRIKKLTLGDLVLSVLPWPFHKDLPDPGKTGPCGGPDRNYGMYCSLSIPIVTLAALILMTIIVSLFDTFFRWIPYLFTCFPIPGLKGKKR